MTLSLDGARERLYAPGHAVVECATAVWTYKYTNGYVVTLRGPLTAHVIITPLQPLQPSSNSQHPSHPPTHSLKFDNLQFDAFFHEKLVSVDSVMGHRVMTGSPSMRTNATPMGLGSVVDPRREEEKKWEEPRVTYERASIPGEPVNAFGIPQATMRCLEVCTSICPVHVGLLIPPISQLAESVTQMGDLIAFATEMRMGPIGAFCPLIS